MASEIPYKKLEQKAKQLILNKEIPPGKMDAVRSLLKNKSLDSAEKYQTIIDLLKNCEDKGVDVLQPLANEKSLDQNGEIKGENGRSYEPTETSYFIVSIYAKYRYLKIFKKRLLVHRNNRFGMGLRKRLIPSRRLIKIMEDIAAFQEVVASRMSSILMTILKDQDNDTPEIFNYLRLFRNWMMKTPLAKNSYETVKWMERLHFEKELKGYIANFYSFLKLNQEKKEEIILQVENTLRMMDDFKKKEGFKGETEQARREREKTNLEKEKKIYEYILLVRSFLPASIKDETQISKHLKIKYNVETFPDLLMIVTEALLYQRPFRMDELDRYLSIQPPLVSKVNWDYSLDFLKKVGKDPESRRQKKIDAIKEELVPFDTIHDLLEYDDGGQNLLLKSVELQWKHIDKKRTDPAEAFRDNYIVFIEAIMQFFKNAYLPLLDGTEIYFRDYANNELSGTIFAPDYFTSKIENAGIIMNEIHYFRSNYPTLSIGRNDVKKIMKKQLKSMDHVERIIRMVGNFFYDTGHDIQSAFELHRLWVYKSGKNSNSVVREALSKKSDDSELFEKGRPLPYYDCTVYSFQDAGPLVSFIQGMPLVAADSMNCLVQKITAFCYQVSHECYNEMLFYDLGKRKELKIKIAELSKS